MNRSVLRNLIILFNLTLTFILIRLFEEELISSDLFFPLPMIILCFVIFLFGSLESLCGIRSRDLFVNDFIQRHIAQIDEYKKVLSPMWRVEKILPVIIASVSLHIVGRSIALIGGYSFFSSVITILAICLIPIYIAKIIKYRRKKIREILKDFHWSKKPTKKKMQKLYLILVRPSLIVSDKTLSPKKGNKSIQVKTLAGTIGTPNTNVRVKGGKYLDYLHLEECPDPTEDDNLAFWIYEK